MQMLSTLWIIGLSALFHTSDVGRYVPNRHSLRSNIMHVISVAGSRRLWVISPSPAGKHITPSHIYILFSICQTFINYKLMKCSTVLGDGANEDIDFSLLSDTSLSGLIPFAPSRSINYYYTYVRPPLTRYDTGITCWRWARHGI